jgi:hypothetical protein
VSDQAELRAEIERLTTENAQLREALTWWQSGKAATEVAAFLRRMADCLSGWSVNNPKPTQPLLSNAACDCIEMVEKLRVPEEK